MSATRAVVIQYTTFVVFELCGAVERGAVIVILLASGACRVDTASGAGALDLPVQHFAQLVE
jgi:hypothetical protein